MYDTRLTIRLEEATKEKLKELAASRGISVGELIRELCQTIFNEVE